MKKIITIVAVMMFVLAVGAVLADEVPIMTWESKDTGTMMNIEAQANAKRFKGDLFYEPQDVLSPTAKKDFGHPPVSDKVVDVGTQLYNSAFETEVAREITGAAAGGVAKEDENTRIWDNLLRPTAESLE
jgi:hypothetical protein